MRHNIHHGLLSELDPPPVLIDIGASHRPPDIWESLALHAVYVGFDPDWRDIHELSDGHFHRAILVNEAITDQDLRDDVVFYLTQSPHCSSVLKPDAESLKHFLFSDLFCVERQQTVRATTLNAVLKRLSLTGIDWLKTDSQGTDLRIFNSVDDAIRARVLAVDIEPGLIHAYIGEDLFVDAHHDLLQQGFWLSNLNVLGTVRMQRSTIETVRGLHQAIEPERLNASHKKTPAWCEARYFRTVEWLTQRECDRRSYILLWLFAQLDHQFGFALDLAVEYERRFGKDRYAQLLFQEAVLNIKRLEKKYAWNYVKKLMPGQLKRWFKSWIT